MHVLSCPLPGDLNHMFTLDEEMQTRHSAVREYHVICDGACLQAYTEQNTHSQTN